VYIRGREGAAGSSGLSILNFIVNFISENRWVQRAFTQEGQLAAEKGIERLMLAV
jgi:hypothetical protein